MNPDFASIEEVIAYYARQTPDKICLIEAKNDRKCNYSDFWGYICAFSHRLRLIGLKPGDRVVVRVSQSIETLVAAFGLHMAGCVYVPVEKNCPDQRVSEIMTQTEARCLIAENLSLIMSHHNISTWLRFAMAPRPQLNMMSTFPTRIPWLISFSQPALQGKPKELC
jgi:acyl-CoA synthetase (AMP-forming)/AMP-acid ligase II